MIENMIENMTPETTQSGLYDLSCPTTLQLIIASTPCFGKGLKTDEVCQGCPLFGECLGEKVDVAAERKAKREAKRAAEKLLEDVGLNKKVKIPKGANLAHLTTAEVLCDVVCVLTGETLTKGTEATLISSWGWANPTALDALLAIRNV
jgi:hypothetical protein